MRSKHMICMLYSSIFNYMYYSRECRSGYGRTRDRQRCNEKEMERECYEEEVQPYRKMYYKPIIYSKITWQLLPTMCVSKVNQVLNIFYLF